MKRTKQKDPLFPACPVRNVLARLCDQWTLLVLYVLDRSGQESLRFKDFRQQIPDISQRMLTTTLRTLEEDGFLRRTVYAEIPPRVEYALSQRAKSLMPHLEGLLQWAFENMDAIVRNREQAHASA